MHEKLNATTTFDASLIDSEQKRVPLVLSDETQVIRWDWQNGLYNLTLSHGEENIDLGRAGILKLFYQHETHGSTPPIGRLENVRLEDGKLKADAVFDAEDEFAMQIFGKIERGFLESVSVGVSILKGTMREFKSKPNEYTATRWELNEVSIVNVPAIPSAKVGLSQTNLNKGNDMEISDITFEFLKENTPEIVAEFTKLGYENGLEVGLNQGAEKEQTRLASLDKLHAPGHESIISAAKLDKTATAESTKLLIFDAMQDAFALAKNNRADDGQTLAVIAGELSSPEAPQPQDEGITLMADAGNKIHGGTK